MQTTLKYKHDSEDTLEALGLDKEKLRHLANHMDQVRRNRKHFDSRSKIFAELIRVCSNPEEIAIIASAIGKGENNECKECPLQGVPSELIEAALLQDLLKGLFGDHGKDGE